MDYDNPAARLLLLLDRGRAFARDKPCREAWEELLDVSQDNPLLMARIGKVMALAQQAIEGIRQSAPWAADTWSHWSEQVNAAFMVQNLQASWATFIDKIDANSFDMLRLTANLLGATTKSKSVSADGLQEWRETLSEILVEVLASEIAQDLKIYISRIIREILEAIDEYALTGAIPLLDRVESAIGHIHLDPAYKSFLKETSTGQRLFAALANIANIVTIAVGLPQIPQGILALADLTK